MQRRTTNNTSSKDLSKIKAEGSYQFDLDFSWLVDVNCNLKSTSLSPNEERISDSVELAHSNSDLLNWFDLRKVSTSLATRSKNHYTRMNAIHQSGYDIQRGCNTNNDNPLGLHVLHGKWWFLSNRTWSLLEEFRKAVSFID